MKAIEKSYRNLLHVVLDSQDYYPNNYNSRLEFLREQINEQLSSVHNWESDLIHDLSIDLASDLIHGVEDIDEMKKIFVGRLTSYVL